MPIENMPCNIPAEQGLIGSLMRDNDAAWEVRVDLHLQDLFDPQCAAVYRAILACLDDDQPAD